MKAKKEQSLGAALALINKIQTTIDGGFRLTLDLPDSEVGLIKTLMDLKSNPYEEQKLYIAFVKKAK